MIRSDGGIDPTTEARDDFRQSLDVFQCSAEIYDTGTQDIGVSYYRKLWIGGMRKAAYPFV